MIPIIPLDVTACCEGRCTSARPRGPVTNSVLFFYFYGLYTFCVGGRPRRERKYRWRRREH